MYVERITGEHRPHGDACIKSQSAGATRPLQSLLTFNLFGARLEDQLHQLGI